MTVCLFCWRVRRYRGHDRVVCKECRVYGLRRAQLAALALELYWRR